MKKFDIIGNILVIIGMILSLYEGINIDKCENVYISTLLVGVGFLIIIVGLILKSKK